jgi:antitoxin VapB
MHTPGAMNTIPDMRHISTLTRERIMRTVSIFKNGNNRAIRLPRDMDFEG